MHLNSPVGVQNPFGYLQRVSEPLLKALPKSSGAGRIKHLGIQMFLPAPETPSRRFLRAFEYLQDAQPEMTGRAAH